MKWLTLKKRIFDKQRKQTTWSGLLRLAEFVKNSRDKKKKMDVISSDKKIRNDAVSSDKNSSNKNQWMLFVVVTVF